jgi:serine/threonine protein phosphatase PrpC
VKAAVISETGYRQEMEDAHFLDLNFANKGWIFGGIYDGHGGNYAAKYASETLHKQFLKYLLAGTSPQEAFVKSYEETSRELGEQGSGTTAVDFLIMDRRIFTANAGDARAIVVNRKEVIQLTVDHRLDNLSERKRVEKMGAYTAYPYVYRGNMGLMPTRTIGDEYFKPVGVIATPSVNEYQISKEDIALVAACDGLFDVMTNEEVADFARRIHNPKALVETLENEVIINRSGTDNLTIIAVSL